MPQDRIDSSSLRHAMLAFAARRGAGDEAEDTVQTTLADAWQRNDRPSEPEALRRWLWGILRHKILDVHRRRGRRLEALPDDDADADVPNQPGLHTLPEESRDLLRWASNNLPPGRDAAETLQWLLREAEGESLETIAEEARLPPARVRKRVSRLREHFRQHWHKEALALAALGITLAVVARLHRPVDEAPPIVAEDPRPRLAPRAAELRRLAGEDCEAGRWRACLDGLDRARALEPDEPATSTAWRERAQRALAPVPSSTAPAPRVVPTTPTTTPSRPRSSPSPTSSLPAPRRSGDSL